MVTSGQLIFQSVTKYPKDSLLIRENGIILESFIIEEHEEISCLHSINSSFYFYILTCIHNQYWQQFNMFKCFTWIRNGCMLNPSKYLIAALDRFYFALLLWLCTKFSINSFGKNHFHSQLFFGCVIVYPRWDLAIMWTNLYILIGIHEFLIAYMYIIGIVVYKANVMDTEGFWRVCQYFAMSTDIIN
jgi:hypothetical protein